MPWSRCYTLNVDNLEVAASSAFELPRKMKPLSGTNRRTVERTQEGYHFLEVIHLNGCLDDLTDHVTFSVLQYAERQATPDPSYLQLITDLMMRPFVFIGSSLDEPPLWQHLELRRNKGGRGQRELRPRSYLVTPSLPRARQALLGVFNTVWLQMTAEEFAGQVLSKLQTEAKIGLSLLEDVSSASRRQTANIPMVTELASKPLKSTDYLIGQEPDWSDIQSGRAIERDVDSTISRKVDEILSHDRLRGVLVITGTAGSGKSSALMRVALKLAVSGHKVGWIDREVDISPRDIFKGMVLDDAPEILAIGDADLYGAELTNLAQRITSGDKRPLLLLEVRSGNMERTIVRSQFDKVPVEDVVMPHLADRDVDALIHVLDQENRLGVLKGLSKIDQIRAFKEQANRQLLVAMYQATSGRRFEDKITEELFELEGESQFVYALLAVASAYRFGLSRDEIIIAVGDKSNTTLNIIGNLLNRHLIVESRDGVYCRARHRVIARILVDALQQRGLVYDVLYGLVLIGASKTAPGARRSARPYRIIRVFNNHDLLYRMLDAEQARNLYGAFENSLNWDSHYWLQRGSLEVEEGDLNLAENFLNQAKSLAPDDPFIDNEWAYLLFRKAINKPGSMDAPDLVEEATEILTRLIGTSKAGDQYPYHVLGSQGLAWARRGIRKEGERSAYLRKVLATVKIGSAKYSNSKDLAQLEQDLTREILSLAIPPKMR